MTGEEWHPDKVRAPDYPPPPRPAPEGLSEDVRDELLRCAEACEDVAARLRAVLEELLRV
jgi:broad specificity phosphatase PhoE